MRVFHIPVPMGINDFIYKSDEYGNFREPDPFRAGSQFIEPVIIQDFFDPDHMSGNMSFAGDVIFLSEPPNESVVMPDMSNPAGEFFREDGYGFILYRKKVSRYKYAAGTIRYGQRGGTDEHPADSSGFPPSPADRIAHSNSSGYGTGLDLSNEWRRNRQHCGFIRWFNYCCSRWQVIHVCKGREPDQERNIWG